MAPNHSLDKQNTENITRTSNGIQLRQCWRKAKSNTRRTNFMNCPLQISSWRSPSKPWVSLIATAIMDGTMLSLHVAWHKINAAVSFPIWVSPHLPPFYHAKFWYKCCTTLRDATCYLECQFDVFGSCLFFINLTKRRIQWSSLLLWRSNEHN